MPYYELLRFRISLRKYHNMCRTINTSANILNYDGLFDADMLNNDNITIQYIEII